MTAPITDRLPEPNLPVGLYFSDDSFTDAKHDGRAWQKKVNVPRGASIVGWLPLQETIAEAQRRRAEYERGRVAA